MPLRGKTIYSLNQKDGEINAFTSSVFADVSETLYKRQMSL